MPNLLPIVIRVAAEKGDDLTFSQARYIARRMEKRCESWLEIDPLTYVLDYWDEVGEMACGFIPNPNTENAARRVMA